MFLTNNPCSTFLLNNINEANMQRRTIDGKIKCQTFHATFIKGN